MSTGETSRSPGSGPAPGDEPVRGRNGAGSLDITRDSDVPISTQLYWQLAYQIDTGRLHAGSRLPTVRELGGVLRVNPNTIRAVYRRLAEAGYVVSRQGAGTRVAARPPVRRTAGTLDGLVAELLRETGGELQAAEAGAEDEDGGGHGRKHRPGRVREAGGPRRCPR